MTADFIKSLAAILDALAWPITAVVIFVLFRGIIASVVTKGNTFRVKVKDVAEFTVEPAQGLRPPSTGTEEERSRLIKNVEKPPEITQENLPLDYYFLNHTSFLRKDKQDEFRRRTGVPLDHYDIRVIVDSYYSGALERVESVEYVLHRAYRHPIQYRRDVQNKFLLKELANGEYVLMAKVFLKDKKDPVLLQRYITLWESGPPLP
jgi:hypothetical protein